MLFLFCDCILSHLTENGKGTTLPVLLYQWVLVYLINIQ